MFSTNIKHEFRKCLICGKRFKFYPNSQKGTGEYCSLQCKGVGMRIPRTLKWCALCNLKFEVPIGYKIKKFCSIECYGKSMENVDRPSFWDTASEYDKLERLKSSFEKYVIRNEDGCWGWKGTPSKKYGSLQYGGKYKTIGAHIASWIIHYGEYDRSLFVCHTCDNPRCANPLHLFLGTPTDNVRDMIKKERNRTPRGEDAFQSKLTNVQVLEIKKMIKSGSRFDDIAHEFGISLPTIYDIKDGRTWNHLENIE